MFRKAVDDLVVALVIFHLILFTGNIGNMPTVISQTQDENEKWEQPQAGSTSGDCHSRACLWAHRKPMNQLTLDVPKRKPMKQLTLDVPKSKVALHHRHGMIPEPKHGIKIIDHFKKPPAKSGIRVRSHVRKVRKTTTLPKRTVKSELEEVPNNDPKLGESLRLVSKMQFDDLMRFRQRVFLNNNN
jgi:hypothetical protein